MKKLAFILCICCSCSFFEPKPLPGPDKQFRGTVLGGGIGAGIGAVTEFQLYGSTTSGAWIGAGFGAVYGLLAGLGVDLLEENQITRQMEEQKLRETAWVREVLAEHYERRLELHPSRDIYPADWFFHADEVRLRPGADLIVREIAQMAKVRKPWSRILVASYSTAINPESSYSEYLNRTRSQNIATELVKSGVEPRRIITKGLTLSEPILIDPLDAPNRYRQAIELIMVD